MTSSFSHISGVRLSGKALGPKLGSVSRAGGVSDVDGDGDGFVTGPDGEDNIPAPVSAAVEAVKGGAGGELLKHIAGVRKDLESRYGDLSNKENARKALQKVFPNAKIHKDFLKSKLPKDVKKDPLRPQQVARIVSLLRDGEANPRAAKQLMRISSVGKTFGNVYVGQQTTSFDLDNAAGEFALSCFIDFDPDLCDSARRGDGKRPIAAWVSVVVDEMFEMGYSQEEIDQVFNFGVASHEFTHQEHSVATMIDNGIDGDLPSLARLMFDQHISSRGGGSYAGTFEEFIAEARKEGKLNSDGAVMSRIIAFSWPFIDQVLNTANKDDLTEAEIRSLGQDEWRKISRYAATNFMEYVAEAGSAVKMGRAVPPNPAWEKLRKWMMSIKVLKRFVSKSRVPLPLPDLPDEPLTVHGCSGFPGIAGNKKGNLNSKSFSDISGLVIDHDR